MSKHVISIEVEDKPGVLTRISSLFSRRGFNIHSLTVGNTHLQGISRFTIVVEGDQKILEQIRKQSQKLIHVLTTKELNHTESIMREIAIIKIQYNQTTSSTINRVVDYYGGRMLDLSNSFMIVEFSGSQEKIDQIFIEFENLNIIESIRTGKLGMQKG